MPKHIHPWDASPEDLARIRQSGGLAPQERSVGEFEESADDSQPYPHARIGGLNTADDLAPYSDTKLGRVDKLIAEGCMQPNLGGDYQVPSSSPQAAGPRRGLYRYENKPSTHNPTPAMPGAE